MRIGQTSMIYFISKIIGSAFGFLATVYFARVLGETVLGYYALVLAIVTWLAIAGNIGVSHAIKKRISEGRERGEYFGAGLLLIAIVLLPLTLALMLFRDQVTVYVGVAVVGFVVLILVVKLFNSIVGSVLQGDHLVHIYAVLSTTKIGIRSLLQVALVLFGFGLSGLLLGYAAGTLLMAIVGLWFIRFRPRIPGKRHLYSLVDFAKFSWLGNMRARTFDTVDIAVLGFFVSAGLIGIYSVAWGIAKFLDIFGSSISATLFPEMSKLSSEEEIEAISGLTEDALTYAGLILIPGLIGAVIIRDRLLLVYGEGFVQGTTILVILICALLFYTYCKQFLNTLNAVDRPDLAFRANGIFIASNVVLNVILIYLFSWVGAAVATTLSALIGLLFAFRYTRLLISIRIPVVEISQQWIAALAMGGIVYVLRFSLEGHALAEINAVFVLMLVMVGTGCYFVILFGISSQFRTTVLNNLPRGTFASQ